ncbi:unnamed protein product [Mycena citricolor]|uniref:Uncharacterized protein n=1 Tax=Mycena citricolor TaxID=2018698 RepID=A0AAD2GY06_9AGAR|nr:unnamed protein product [Mycena citricolor]
MLNSKARFLPLGWCAIGNSQIGHEVARQELTRPFPADLRLEVFDSDGKIRLLHARREFLHTRREVADERVDELDGDRLPRVQARPVFDPLPQLHPRDLSRGRVLHEVVERDAAVAPDPGRRVGQGRRHVLLHSCLSDLSGDGGVQQISSGNAHFLPAHMVLASHQETIREDGNRKTHLVGTKHVLIEHRARNRLDERVGNPGPVVTCEHLPQFIRTDFVHRHFVRLGVVLDRDLR